MTKLACALSVVLLGLGCFSSAASAADAEGCKDSPLVTRFPGSVITACSDKGDDLVRLPIDRGEPKLLESEVHIINYDFPKTASKAQVYRNLRTALEKAGFTFVYDTLAGAGDFVAQSGKTWIFVEVSGGGGYRQTVAIETKLTQEVTANANAHYGAIADSEPVAADVAGCKDSPFVTRYPKSVLRGCVDKPDDLVSLPVGTERKQIEGELHQSRYDFPKTASKAEVYRNLKTALQTAGFTLVYDSSAATGDLTAHVGSTWILEEVSIGGGYTQTIVIETKLSQLVSANAEAMYGSLSQTGHSAVYGILFDTGKAEIKPSSAAALKEIVKLLQKEPTLRVYVVGHTDNVGSVPSNLDLSQRRAAAVVHALVSEYGIAAGILDSFGAGPYSPVASNDKEEGRALNRRVELVKQ